MTCNNCGGPTHEVSATKATVLGTHVVERLRICLKCEQKFRTIEAPSSKITFITQRRSVNDVVPN